MEARRKAVGQHIKATRRKRGYRSQKAFAGAINVHETSVANAEIGSDRIGAGAVYASIEDGLQWPTNSIVDYIEGRTENLPGADATDAAEASAARQRILALTDVQLAERIVEIAEVQGVEAAGAYLAKVREIRQEAERAAVQGS